MIYRVRLRPSRWGLGRSVLFSLVALVLTTFAISIAAWLFFGKPPRPKAISPANYFDAIKIVLAVVAGLGASIGLTVSYRKQRGEESGAFTTRYTAAAEQLGHEKAAVRLAGVYALAQLADEWELQRQQCIDVLCAYVRMPYDPATASNGESQVRRTVLDVIGAHLRRDAAVSWSPLRFNFTRAVLDSGGDFHDGIFVGAVSFSRAHFIAGDYNFTGSEFRGTVDFGGSTFEGGRLFFQSCTFLAGLLDFTDAIFDGELGILQRLTSFRG